VADPTTPPKALLEELFPLHRTLASEGTDTALDLLGAALAVDGVEWTTETYAPGTAAWTWRIPERYVVHEAYLEHAQTGERIADFAWSPLHVVSYSEPVDALLTFDELDPHLHHAERRPDAIPWEFKFYERSWGFCLSYNSYLSLPRDGRFRAVIRSEFDATPEHGLRVGVALVHPEGGPDPDAGELLVCAHVDHPAQANDDTSGVVSAVEAARRLAARPLAPGSMSVRFLFCPETIGSIAYLSHHEDLIDRLRGAIYSEMTGNRNDLALQLSHQGDDLIDRVARRVLTDRGAPFREGAFRTVIGNDEMVINGPGVGVPCVSLSRWPYDEYHTSDDNPDIVDEALLVEAAEVIEAILRIRATDYVPRRTFKGPVFLSRYGLWVDWRENMALNRKLEHIMLRLEGDLSVFAIAEEIELPFADVHGYLERFRAHGLIEVVAR
jgi:aminopeptidase-like protein